MSQSIETQGAGTPKEISLTNWGALVCCLVMIFLVHYWGDWFALLAALFGSLAGWLLGVLASPFDTEKTMFEGYGKSIAAFATGFLVSKIDKVFDLIIAKQGENQPLIFSIQVLRPSVFGVCSLILVAVYTFTLRHYGQRQRAESSDAKELQQFREAAAKAKSATASQRP